MKVQTFLAIGGPLNGFKVTEDYAGDEYTRYNCSGGLTYKTKLICDRNTITKHCVYERDEKGKKIPINEKCVLIHDSIFTKEN